MPSTHLVFDSSPPSASYMCQCIRSAMVEIMVWHQIGAKPLSKPMLGDWSIGTLGKNFYSNFNQNTKLFIHEIASENIICKMATIFSRGRWVNMYMTQHPNFNCIHGHMVPITGLSVLVREQPSISFISLYCTWPLFDKKETLARTNGCCMPG